MKARASVLGPVLTFPGALVGCRTMLCYWPMERRCSVNSCPCATSSSVTTSDIGDRNFTSISRRLSSKRYHASLDLVVRWPFVLCATLATMILLKPSQPLKSNNRQ